MSADRVKIACSRDPVRPSIATPFTADFEGRKWAAGTDGHIIVMLPLDAELRTDGPDVAKALAGNPPPTHTVNVRMLRAWAGCVRAHADVCYCAEEDEDGKCVRCGGFGYIVESTREGLLLFGALNRILLARVLSLLDAEVAQVGQAHNLAPYIFRAPDFIGAVMPLREASADVPRFTELQAVAP